MAVQELRAKVGVGGVAGLSAGKSCSTCSCKAAADGDAWRRWCPGQDLAMVRGGAGLGAAVPGLLILGGLFAVGVEGVGQGFGQLVLGALVKRAALLVCHREEVIGTLACGGDTGTADKE